MMLAVDGRELPWGEEGKAVLSKVGPPHGSPRVRMDTAPAEIKLRETSRIISQPPPPPTESFINASSVPKLLSDRKPLEVVILDQAIQLKMSNVPVQTLHRDPQLL
jgi:hypothetical protein